MLVYPCTDYAEGRKLSTQHPHRDAVQPACQHFGTCGGCNLQSLSYLAQLDHKAAYVGQRFSRVGKLNPVDVAAAQQPAVAAEAVYGCRNKVQMAFSSLVWQADADQVQPGQQQQLEPPQAQQQQEGTVRQGFGLGYFLPGSNSVVVPIQECSLLVSVSKLHRTPNNTGRLPGNHYQISNGAPSHNP
jgi:23S rRNA (uracil1939-C5)-methyltransferase